MNVKFIKGNLRNREKLKEVFETEDITAAILGEPVKEKIDDKHQQLPINPYGKSKLMVEKILEDYDTAYSLKNVVLRYFNVSGSDKEGIIGEGHVPKTHLILLILQRTNVKKREHKNILR